MTSPRKWTAEELAKDAAIARAAFRDERIKEPLELYSATFGAFQGVVDAMIDMLPALADDKFDIEDLCKVTGDEDLRRAFCYLTAPPISEDDLKTVAEVASFRPSALRRDTASAKRLRDTVFKIMDLDRFPWLADGREPTDEERLAAIVATSSLVAASRVATHRRNDAKERQEGAVKQVLADLGYTEVTRRAVATASAAPKPKTFMGETTLAGTKADVIATLPDGRIMPIECKVSNSTVNSYKRIVHDTGGKATIWYREIGRANLVVSAVLSGVFSSANCVTVQNDKDVHFFWEHRLGDLADFVKSQG